MSNSDYSLYISGAVDDYGWDAFEFRMLARIYRRCSAKDGFTGVFYESVPSLGDSLKMSRPVVRRTLTILERAGAIAATIRPGNTTKYRVLEPSQWVASDTLVDIRARVTPIKNARGNENGTAIRNDRTPLPQTTELPLSKTVDEGFPSEVLPSEGFPSLKNGETPVAAVAAADKQTDDPWTAGIELLKDTMTEAQARPFLGRLAKEYSAAEMLTAIQATSDEKPADARAFLIAVLKKRAKDKARGQVGRSIASSTADFPENCLVCFDTGEALIKDADGFMIGNEVCPACTTNGTED